jgi:hypothetical protein
MKLFDLDLIFLHSFLENVVTHQAKSKEQQTKHVGSKKNNKKKHDVERWTLDGTTQLVL